MLFPCLQMIADENESQALVDCQLVYMALK